MASGRSRCTAPGTVSADDLVAAARGDAPAAVREHLQGCESCRSRVDAYSKSEHSLRRVLFRSSCPSSITIGEYALGSLPGAEASLIAEHLIECPHCAHERSGFSSFLSTPDLSTPDGTLHGEAPPHQGGIARLLRSLLALPVSAPTAAPALRGDDDETTVSYQVDGYELTVGSQRPTGRQGRIIAGLLLAGFASPAGVSVRLFSGEQLRQTARVDDLANFFFEDVAAGDYRLEIGLIDSLLVIEPLHVS